jgi:hypothetical protein
VFYLSGEGLNTFSYGLAGAVQIDSTGHVSAGEQDYNDGTGNLSSDTINGGTLSVSSTTGQGTLTLVTNNPNRGVQGTETLGVQFVNANHALIIQFDGTATSSGSLDTQTLPATLSGGYAFTLAGLDPTQFPVALGGVFTISGTNLQNGSFDTNDDGVVALNAPLSGTLTPVDGYGRGTITTSSIYSAGGTPVVLNYYVVGPEVLRIIDVDFTDSAIGSAFGQGVNATAATNASLKNSVFGIAGDSPNGSIEYAASGMFSVNSSAATFSGIADDNEPYFSGSYPASAITGSYGISSNGYGGLTIAGLGDITTLGIYMTDPNLNLSDPNNTTSGLGGALAADMDGSSFLSGGIGVLVPQTDTSSSSFTGNYDVGGQVFSAASPSGEVDFVGVGSVTSLALSGTGLVSDLSSTLGAQQTNSGVPFSGTVVPDTTHPGRYTISPLQVTVGTTPAALNVAVYQASGGQLFWVDSDDATFDFLGSLQQQGSLAGIPGTNVLTETVAATSGTPQSTLINTAFSAPLVATVTTGGSPTSGVVVTFTAPASGASGTFVGGSSTATAMTNSSGIATSPTFTANGTAGTYTVTAAAAGVPTPANFSLTNTGGAVEAIAATSGTPQSALINTAFAAPLVATVTTGGTGTSSVMVTFTAPASGASGTFVGGGTTATATTDVNGIATSPTFTANGTTGTYMVTAAAAGVSPPASFSLTNTAEVVETITATSGTPQSAVVSTAFAAPLVATVTTGGTGTSGVVVTFTAPASGASGTFAGGSKTATATTNSSGIATSPTFTANSTTGSYTVTAAAAGVSPPASFSLTNTAAAVETITATSGTPQSAVVSTAFAAPLVATVTTGGTGTNGVVVTFTAPASGASGTFAGGSKTATATTNSSGIATSPTFTANATTGSYTVTASAPGVSPPASFSLTNTAAAVETITATSGTPQSAVVSTAFAAPLVATVTTGGTGTSGVVVSFTAPASGASGTFAGGSKTATATTNSSGIATSPTFTANGTTGSYTVTASAPGVSTPADFSLTNTAAAVETITATSGTPQSAVVSTAFASPLVATVTTGGSGTSGVVVTFTAPASGASGTFAGGGTTVTATTNSSGIATSPTFTANATTGSYTVTAAAVGATTPADFSLTNTSVVSVTKTYVFNLNGEEASAYIYALAGSVQIDGSGNVLGGVQDYNDGAGSITSPQPSGDAITGGKLVATSIPGQFTLTLNTDNSTLGGGTGTETLGVQFVNASHALIIRFEGAATASGSMDVQTLPASLSGGYAFTLNGTDPSVQPVAFGGVFSISGTTLKSGFLDTNDFGAVTTHAALSGTISGFDSFGRGTISSSALNYNGTPVALNYYVVGPEALRIIDVDFGDSAGGSAFGQGTNATGATNASLKKSVFGIIGSPDSLTTSLYAATGMFSTTPSSATFSGVADSDEMSSGIQLSASPISGSYTVAHNGYGSMSLSSALGDITALGIYVTDPNLNLSDPNNTTSGLGGALIADMDATTAVAGGIGIVVPQTATSTASFTGKYAFGGQDYNFISNGEFDFVGAGSVTSLSLSGTGLLTDPFNALGAQPTDSVVTFSGTFLADPSNPGRYTLSSSNSTPNPLQVTIGGVTSSFDVAAYQASGGLVLWLNEDFNTVFLGSLQQQGSLSGIPAARNGLGKASVRRRK